MMGAGAKKKVTRPVVVSATWGYDLHRCSMALRTWKRVVAGVAVYRKEPFWYEGKKYTGEWHFNHKGFGRLHITFDDCGVGFDSDLANTIISINDEIVKWSDVGADHI